MYNNFDTTPGLSRVSERLQNRELEMSPRQAEIYRNLGAIGPEIAAFYLSGIKVLRDNNLDSAPYLLAHIAREIEGGLRDVLASGPDKRRIQEHLKKKNLGNLRERIGHVASILAALGIDDLHSPLAERWITVATRFHEFSHRHGAWEPPRSKDTFVPLWNEFENVLADLVGSYFDLLNQLDRILKYEKPTKEIRKTLPNLLASDVRREYFFTKLDSPAWLKPLKEDGWFNPEQNPAPQEVAGFTRTLPFPNLVCVRVRRADCQAPG